MTQNRLILTCQLILKKSLIWISILFFNGFSLYSQESAVVIDRLIFLGDDRINSNQLIHDLDVPIGTRLSPMSAAELVSDIDRKLRASGRFKEDLSVRLVKGNSYPLFNIEIKSSLRDEFYTGFTLSLGIDENIKEGNFSKIGSANAFFGSRGILTSDWTVDIESKNFHLDSKILESATTGEIASQVQGNGIFLSLGNTSIFGGNAYLGFMTKLTHINALTAYNQTLNISTTSSKNQYNYRQDSHSKMILGSIETFCGMRFFDFTLGTSFSRSAARNYWTRTNDQNYSIGNDGKIVSQLELTPPSIPNYNFRNDLELMLKWSLKPKIAEIESGGEYLMSWKRTYESDSSTYPELNGAAEYTVILPQDYALSPGLKYKWSTTDLLSFENLTNYKKHTRYLELNFRIEKFFHQGDIYHFGLARSSLLDNYPTPFEQYKPDAKTMVSLGYKFTSSSFIYDLSATIGSSHLSEGSFENINETTYKRLGVK
jgi:hypothetical protein